MYIPMGCEDLKRVFNIAAIYMNIQGILYKKTNNYYLIAVHRAIFFIYGFLKELINKF